MGEPLAPQQVPHQSSRLHHLERTISLNPMRPQMLQKSSVMTDPSGSTIGIGRLPGA